MGTCLARCFNDVPSHLKEVPMMEKFHHVLPDGHEVDLPKFENIPVGKIRRIRKLGPTDQAFTLLEELLGEDDLAHVDELTAPQLQEFMKAWRDGSSVDLGESSASSS